MAFVHPYVVNTSKAVTNGLRDFLELGLVIGKPYRSYVAIGDSLSEGLGDFTFHHERHNNGWTDRLANVLAKEAQDIGHAFHYANLALRGSRLSSIVQNQLRSALRFEPDLVTVMAGSNDLMSKVPLEQQREQLANGVLELLAAGSDVVLATTINPAHLRLFKPLRKYAAEYSTMIKQVGEELGVAVLDVHGIESFQDLLYWADDMVHFSGHGHIKVANRAAALLDLKYRYPELDPKQLSPVGRGLTETVNWVARDVIPFFGRKLRGVTSGDGMQPKLPRPTLVTPMSDREWWQLTSV